ncbi:MAG: CAP domain-containing protein [Anaerobutyricum sp.]
MGEGIMQFYMEKQYWVKENPTGEETGHYTSIINPKYKYVGCGDFYSKLRDFQIHLQRNCRKKRDLMSLCLEQRKM